MGALTMAYIVSAAGNFLLTEDESAGCLNVGLSDSGIFRMEMEEWKGVPKFLSHVS